MTRLRLRPASANDRPFLRTMPAVAAHEPDVCAVERSPALTHLIDDGRPSSDPGLIACNPDPVGAAWLVSPTDTQPGFAAIASDVPELVLAVAPTQHGQGIGTRLLGQLLTQTRDDIPRIGLSVREDNPAIRLYARAGFVPLPDRRQRNRTGSWSIVMQLDRTGELHMPART